MPGVLKTDCRVKPEVRSFNRLESKLAGSLHFYNRATLLLRIKTRLKWVFMYRRGQCHHRGGLMILPWAHRLISAGAHGLRRIPGQSVNLAHLIWRTPRAPAPLPSGNKVHPRWFSTRGYGCWGLRPYHDQSHRDCLRGSGDGVRNVCFSQRERLCLHYPIVGPAWHPRHVEI
jgi:hypothetical protein